MTLDQAWSQRHVGLDGKVSLAVKGVFAHVDTLDYFTMGTSTIILSIWGW